MIVREDRNFESLSVYPNTDWYNEGNYVVDETTEEGKPLVNKIKEHSPYFDFVLDGEGNLIDITPTERPPAPTPEPTVEEQLLSIQDDFDIMYAQMLMLQGVDVNV